MNSRTAWAIVALCYAWILISFSRNPGMLADTDTIAAIRAIREADNPLKWLGGDWPLGNHFYRPVSTLVFEFDVRFWGGNAAGWGFSNALLCSTTVGCLAWLVWELFRKPGWVAGCAAVFTFWTLADARWLPFWLVGVAVAGSIYVSRRFSGSAVGLFALGWWIHFELANAEPLRARMMDWIPGRTASTMAIFALASMACFARAHHAGARWGWAAAVCLALALGSYEQAVMLPACLTGVSIYFACAKTPVTPRWAWNLGFWVMLGGYFLLKQQILPAESSAYQAQQMRGNGFSWITFSAYCFPAWPSAMQFWTLASTGVGALWVSSLYGSAAQIMACGYGGIAAWLGRRRWEAAAGWLWSMVAFLPMAWVKNFEHYHFWPLALRSILVVALAVTWWDRMVRPDRLAAELCAERG